MKNTMEVNGCCQLFGYRHCSNIFLCAQWRKKTHTGFEQEEGEFSVLGELSLKVARIREQEGDYCNVVIS